MLRALHGLKPFCLHRNPRREGTLIIPTLQKRKLSFREVEGLDQSQTDVGKTLGLEVDRQERILETSWV